MNFLHFASPLDLEMPATICPPPPPPPPSALISMRRPVSEILGQLWEINGGPVEAKPTSQILKTLLYSHMFKSGKYDRFSVNQRSTNLVDRHVV